MSKSTQSSISLPRYCKTAFIWILNNIWPPFLLENLPPTDSAPLANYLPYLNLMELLREHADQILTHPITISIKPGDLFLLKDLLPSPLGLWWTIPHLVILRPNGIPQWQHLLRNRLLKPSRKQHFTMVLLANAHLNAYISCSPILKLPPLYHTTCLLLLIKILTSSTSRDINLSKTAWKKTAIKAPSRTPQEPEDPAPYNAPWQQEVAKETNASPQLLILSPYPHHY
jgi:hypothetical protein